MGGLTEFTKKTVRDIKLDGKLVMVSVDYNVPGDDQGHITDGYRIAASLPTLQYLLSKKCRIVLMSHRGRPEGKVVPALSLQPVAKKLAELIKHPVAFAEDCIGPACEKAKQELKPGQILLLENTRFHKGEEENDPGFARELRLQAEVFVQDAFGNAHRKHASTEGITHYVPSVAGLLLEKEVTAITTVMHNPKRPLMAIIGGAKIADKLAVLKALIGVADVMAVGGAMANTFLLAQGVDIGKSVSDKADLSLAQDILELAEHEAKKRPFVFYVPQDAVVATSPDTSAHTRIVDFSAHVIAEIENYPKNPNRQSGHIGASEMILDIGPFSGAFIAGSMQLANTVLWNGSMGVTETPSVQGPIGPFAHGTELIVEAMMGQFGHRPYTLVGGGDTVGYIENRKLMQCFNHVSTGGGASLELMAGKTLPAVAALLDNKRTLGQKLRYNKNNHK